MQSLFDTCGAVFEPEQVGVLQAAFREATLRLGPGMSQNTQRKLTKVIVNLARWNIKTGSDLDAEALSEEAVDFISQLRSAQWLA